MPESINVNIGFFTHPKTIRLMTLAGTGSEARLIQLWAYVGDHRPDTGGFDDWTPEEVEAAADWTGEKGLFVDALLKCRWIHQRENDGKTGFYMHDWKEHQPHLVKYAKVKNERKKAANKRWDREKKRGKFKEGNELEGDAKSMQNEDFAYAKNEFCNANAVQCKAVQCITTTTSVEEEKPPSEPSCELPLAPPCEPPPAPPPKPKVEWDGGDFTVPDVFYEKWEAAYPGVDISREISKAAAWLIANPRKAKKDYGRFLNGWLGRARPATAPPEDTYAIDPELVAWGEALERGEAVP